MNITEHLKVPGDGPIVIIGPNGSGKTRLGVSMLSLNKSAERIAALRNIALTENTPLQRLDQARANLAGSHTRRRSRYWEMSNEIDQLFSKLMVEDSASAVAFRDEHSKDNAIVPQKTTLMTLRELWERLFPGRQISFSGNSPKVTSSLLEAEGKPYLAQKMSDGERVAVYLAARVLDTSEAILVVDEPEVYLHSRLAARFWNEMETMRPDVRLVYITHDLPFALSRSNATFVNLKSAGNPSRVELQEEVPRALAQSLLSAASFSIHAQRIVFCEGEEGRSLDYDLYSAWFHDLETAVIPVGNCRDVAETATRFAESTWIAGLAAIGIVDRDYWPDAYLDQLGKSVCVLPFHEIESLLCLKGVFCAVAEHLGKSADLYSQFIEKAKAKFDTGLLVYQVTERFKRRVENEFLSARNALKPKPTMDETSQHCAEALEPTKWQTQPDHLFSAERALVQRAHTGTADEFLKVFPGKVFFSGVMDILGIEQSTYAELICSALKFKGDASDPLYKLGEQIERALAQVLPPRKVTTDTARRP